MLKIAIQGELGAYSHIASKELCIQMQRFQLVVLLRKHLN